MLVIKPTHARYLPSAAERAQLRLNALHASMRAREHGIVDPVKAEKDAAWRRGDLRWKLDPRQQELYDAIKACQSGEFDTEGARKLGKSWTHGVIALETAIKNPGKRINWAAITGKESRGTLLPILEELSADAPADCKGKVNSEDQWVTPNSAFVQLIGADTKKACEKGRGPSSILNIIDEAGFHEHLLYLADSILKPQMRRVRRVVGSFVGMTLLVSTTPYTPAHPFCVMADAAASRGAYRRYTIWDSGWETREEIEQYIAEKAAEKNMDVAAFMRTTHFRREYLSERVVDEDVVVFPEFSEVGADGKTGEERVVMEWPRPIGFDQFIYKRTAGDPGGTRDPTGILAGYVDFTNAKVVVEGERLLARPNTKDIFEAVVELETELWGPTPDPPAGQPYFDRSRISRAFDDPTGRVTLDLWEIHRLHCQPAVKNDRNASIGLIRTYLTNGTIVIDPRCVKLIHQLRTSLNNKNRTDFERNSEGHCDLAATLMYFVRDLSLVVNPYPASFESLTGREMPDQHPIMARRAAMGQKREMTGLAGQLLSGNRFVAGQLRRRR